MESSQNVLSHSYDHRVVDGALEEFCKEECC
jgi:pyruvate/2-oxoglutarate dehydrogenase complex dihydrolipoamide acyltransferase (E2) component